MDFQVDKVAIYEPRLDFGNGKKPWVITKAAEQSTYISYPADAYNSSNITFNLKPPSKYTVADRVMEIIVPVQLVFTRVAPPGLVPTLRDGRDAFRYMPFSSCVESIQMKLNGYSISCQLKDIIHPLTRYHADGDFYNGANSIGPNMYDYFQAYEQGVGSSNNSLGNYNDNTVQVPRGAYPLTNIVQNDENGATIQAKIREFIYMPPCIWNNDQVPGLVGLDNLQFTFNLSNLPRMWSRACFGQNYTEGDVLTGVTVSIYDKPQMLVNWLSPPITQPIPRLLQYPYFEITRYQNAGTFSAVAPAVGLPPGGSGTVKSNMISLNSIPRKIFIYATRPQSQQSLTTEGSVNPQYGAIGTTDTYLRIDKLRVSWGNQNAVFAGADIVQLYQMSCKNGLKMGFVEFFGLTGNFPDALGADPLDVVKGTIGSVICICPSGDLPLAANESEGMLCQKNLQVEVDVTNCNLPSGIAEIDRFNTFTPDLNIIAVYDGVLEIYDNSCRSYVGVINEDDVVNTPIDHSIDYNVLSRVYGGSALEKFRNLSNKAINAARKGNKFLKDTQAVSKGLEMFGKQGLADKAKAYGYGSRGGVLYEPTYGGKKVSKRNLKSRLSKY